MAQTSLWHPAHDWQTCEYWIREGEMPLTRMRICRPRLTHANDERSPGLGIPPLEW